MATTETLQKIADTSGMPVDPNVRIPDHVRRASAAVEQLHKAAYTPPPQPEPQQVENPTQQVENPPQEPVADPTKVAAETVPPVPALKPGDENVTAEEWRHRFLSMQGRFNSAQRTIGSMEQQMTDLGQELVKTQNMVAELRQDNRPNGNALPQPQLGQPHEKLITDEDRQAYGDDLIDLARRAGREAVAPELERLNAENKRLTDQVKNTSRRELFASMDRSLPQWRQINVDTRFKTWLRLPNVYTGQLRSEMLNAAVADANAPRVLQFFRDFLTEAQATGHTAPAQQEQQPDPQPVPRTPAVNLETLASPGRARPASGDNQVPADKPIYTRAQISKFYEDSRKGLYAGRQAEYDAIQNDLSAAQREGRIRG